MESVTTVMSQVLGLSRAGMRPMHMDINSASIGVMFIACRLSWFVTELSAQMYATANAILDFLTPPSAMMAMLYREACDCLKALLSFWM